MSSELNMFNSDEILQAKLNDLENGTGNLNIRVAVDLIVPEEQQPEVPHGPQVEASEANIMDVTSEALNIPTQEPLSQAIKRTSDLERIPKKLRPSGTVAAQEMGTSAPKIIDNIPPDFNNLEQATEDQLDEAVNKASEMIHEAGLADVVRSSKLEKEAVTQTQAETSGTSSETPLGSLDRTKVSLGDTVEEITESRRFIREHWGVEGTLRKIVRLWWEGGRVDIDRLIERGPLIAGYKRQIAASCFTSILTLKQHAFVSIEKDSGSTEIKHVSLGSKFMDL